MGKIFLLLCRLKTNDGWIKRGGGGNEKVETYVHSHCAIGTQTYGYDADDPRDSRSEIPNVMH